MRARHLTLVLALDAAALGAAALALVLGVGLPLAARGMLGPARVVALALLAGTVTFAVGAALLIRSIGRPVDRLIAAAESLGRGAASDLPLLEPPGEAAERGLSRAAVAFERLAAALVAERFRLAEKVSELERANSEILRARESLLRSERLATLGRLASGIAHEVGNPLGAIGGYVELARDRLKDAPQRANEADDFLARIGAETQRIDRIVRDLLDLARPAEPALASVRLEAPLDAALRLARVQGRFKAVDVEIAIQEGMRPVLADERRLAQVFLNLLLNAGDAMAGAGRVRIAAREQDGRVEVEVCDTGPGIPAADLEHVFEPFFTTKGAGQGTGLGLAVSQGIVESFGGELRASNAPGGGAVLTMRLAPAR